jgi:hypothetical protein
VGVMRTNHAFRDYGHCAKLRWRPDILPTDSAIIEKRAIEGHIAIGCFKKSLQILAAKRVNLLA